MARSSIVHSLAVLLIFFSSITGAVTPTPEQIKMFQQLSPEQQAAILKSTTGGKGVLTQPKITQPQVVKPRIVTSPADEQDKEGSKVTLKVKQKTKAAKQILKPFGYDLFAGTPTTFAPATDIPVPVNYVIGPGDTVEVQLFGKENEQHSLVVTREGILNFPGLGPVTVVGLSFSELKRDLQKRIKAQMIGVKASITLGTLRSIRIFVLGDAERPGSYTVSSLTTMTNALFVSGGIRPIGSLRDIQLKRKGKIVSRLDLYDLLLKGDTRNDARLLPGDVLFIPPVGKTAGVGGEVRRPAIYELKNEKTASDLVNLAGGFLPTAYPQASQLERINKQHERTLVDINLDTVKGKTTRVSNGDIVRIYSVLEKMEDIILLSGHVERPGGQQWQKGMRLTDVLPSATTLLPKTDLNYVVIRRELMPDGRIQILSADYEKALKTPSSPSNVLLQPRDEVIVFGLGEARAERIKKLLDELENQATSAFPNQQVSVGGRVHAPGAYPLEPGMRVSDLLRAAGKLKESAYVVDAELTRYKIVNGKYREAKHISINLAQVIQGNAESNIRLKAYDHLTIKDIPRWTESETITLKGEVKFPGVYPIRRGESLASVIERAGGITELAFVDGAVFMRKGLRIREQKQMDDLAARLESDISAASLESTKGDAKDANIQQAVTVGKSLVTQLRNTKAAGRLVINLKKILASKNTDSTNTPLFVKDGDMLVVPRQTQSVTVLGEVHYPTSHIYNSSLTRDEYIGRSGGATYKADKKRIYVVRANGEVIANNDSFWSFDNSSIEIKKGDTIIIPLDAERIKPLTLWTNVTQILYQVGVAVAAFNSAGIF